MTTTGTDHSDDEFGPQLTLTAMVDRLEATHHAYLRRALPRLELLAIEMEVGAAGEHREVVRLVRALRAELEPHLVKEEQVLFPFVRQLDGAGTLPRFPCGSIRNPIGMMLVEHDRTGALLDRLHASLTGGEPGSGLAVPDPSGSGAHRRLHRELIELEADTRRHIAREDRVLFPAAMAAERALVERLATASPDQGGDPACWAHRFGEP